jgi:two-component system, chemotaxis family, response regulator Rcp1
MSVTISEPARILVIEDSPADVHLLRHALNQHSDEYELEILQDGEQALEFIYEQRTVMAEPRPCVIVLDLHLPKHDGLSVLEAIKQTPPLAHLHVVALTSLFSPRDEAEVRSLGVRLYCEKPNELDAWIALAGKILEYCREPVTSGAA